MPELPDLEVFSSNLNKRLKGKKVEKIAVPESKKLNVSVAELKKEVEGQKVKKIYREGKELHISFSNETVLGLHLMLHGNLNLFENKNTSNNAVIEILFDDNTGLALTDYQRAATPTLNPKERDAPDALSKDVTYTFLKENLQTRTKIKTLLMDQKVIRGIGNAYADEILWDAKISPLSTSNKIPVTQIKALAHSIKKVLTDAAKNIRKKDPDIISGEVRDFLPIHNSHKKESPGGAAIKTTTVGSRKTYYTEEQKLFK
jgi:formamidopyrimidine-DNA glycosylase